MALLAQKLRRIFFCQNPKKKFLWPLHKTSFLLTNQSNINIFSFFFRFLWSVNPYGSFELLHIEIWWFSFFNFTRVGFWKIEIWNHIKQQIWQFKFCLFFYKTCSFLHIFSKYGPFISIFQKKKKNQFPQMVNFWSLDFYLKCYIF